MRSNHYLTALVLLALTIVGCAGEEASTAQAEDRRPNLLLLVSDDQGTVLGCYGTPGVQTPELDALAASGTRFTRAYAPSAVCTPSRSSIYTGLMPAQHGATGFQEVKEGVTLWAEHFARAGYRTGLIGKIGAKPVKRFTFDFIARSDKDDVDARSLPWHVKELDAFLEADDGRPWVLVVNFRDSHFPFPTDGAPYGAGAVEPHAAASVTIPGTLLDAPEVRAEVARFYDGLRRMDATVGAMVERLGERDEGANTVGMFTSDNGPPFPFAKTTLYEAGIHMPLLAWGTGVEAGATRDEFVSLVDVLPTFLDFAGDSGGGAFDGRSMAALLRAGAEPTPPWRTAIFATHDAHRVEPDIPSRSVRFDDWKYIRTWPEGRLFANLVMHNSGTWRAMVAAADGGDEAVAARLTRFVQRPEEELFDLAADPFELNNLAGAPQHQEVLKRARELVEESELVSLPSSD